MPIATLIAQTDDATAAAYHRIGYRSNLFDEDFVKDWAYDIIRQRDKPPIAIIEVATAPNRTTLSEALDIASDGGDSRAAAGFLLDHLYRELSENRISAASAVHAASYICRLIEPNGPAHIAFFILNEDLCLDEDGIIPFSGDSKLHALKLLADFGAVKSGAVKANDNSETTSPTASDSNGELSAETP